MLSCAKQLGRYSVAAGIALLLALSGGQVAAAEEQPVAAYQVELKVVSGDALIVGVEGGEDAALFELGSVAPFEIAGFEFPSG